MFEIVEYDYSQQKKQLLEWIHLKTGSTAITNFTTDWSNGIALCALVDIIAPGSCPRYDLLEPRDGLRNIKLALSIISQKLNTETVSRRMTYQYAKLCF